MSFWNKNCFLCLATALDNYFLWYNNTIYTKWTTFTSFYQTKQFILSLRHISITKWSSLEQLNILILLSEDHLMIEVLVKYDMKSFLMCRKLVKLRTPKVPITTYCNFCQCFWKRYKWRNERKDLGYLFLGAIM